MNPGKSHTRQYQRILYLVLNFNWWKVGTVATTRRPTRDLEVENRLHRTSRSDIVALTKPKLPQAVPIMEFYGTTLLGCVGYACGDFVDKIIRHQRWLKF